MRFRIPWLCLCVALAMAATLPVPGVAPEGQTVFDSPDKALDTLMDAVEAADREALETIFGPGSLEVISSGDEVADEEAREAFLDLADEGISFELSHGGQVILLFGAEKWPFPVALARQGDGWYFDTESGKEEILNRRVGRNEIYALATCRAYVNAQQEYFREGRDGNPPAYAQQFLSNEGKQNGLFWVVAEGEPESPLGPILADAALKYGVSPTKERRPFHGYYYQILTSQGENAKGGAKEYIVDGLMTEGFGLVAWPATYGNSGVMTFLVDRQGAVFQKDLGPETDVLARIISTFDPDDTWNPTMD